jgi:peptidoglycan-N-acetylglucosamine deacetylase
MAANPARRAALALLVAGALVMAVGSVIIWRMLSGPSIVMGEGGAAYVAPTAIPSVLPEPQLDGLRVAVLEEPQNVQVTAPGFYAAELARWREWVREAGGELTVAEESEVLVLPFAECLSAGARQAVARQLRRGGGVITAGLVGARDSGCTAQADTVLVELLGRHEGEAPFARPQHPSPHAVVLGESVFGAGVPAGARFELSPMSRLVFHDSERAVFYSDFLRSPVPEREQPFFDAALTRALVDQGRIVAFGFGLREVGEGWSEQIVRLVVANALTWAGGRPVVQLATWPNGHLAAALVAQDVEADFGNASAAVEVMERHGIPTTFFLVAELARMHRFVTRRLTTTGEIASHSYHHAPMDGFSSAGEREELELASREIEALTGQRAIGFRPPMERYTMETLRHWAELGGEYFFSYNHLRSSAPEIVPFGPDSLVFLGRVVDDDFEIVGRAEMRDRGEMVRLMLRQLDEVVQLRGNYLFSYHSHIMAQEALIPVLEAVVSALRARPEVWVASGAEISRWWRARAAVRVERGAGVARLHNQGRGSFEGGELIVDLADGVQHRLDVPPIPPSGVVEIPLPDR